MKVYVVAPAGRFIPGYGGRPCGGVYDMPADEARALAAQDDGLSLDNPKKTTGKPVEKPAEPVTEE